MNRPARSHPGRPGTRVITVLAGCWHPVVLILLLISFFTTISGKPLDGVLMLAVGGALAWDAGRRRRARAAAAGSAGTAASAGTAGLPPGCPAPATPVPPGGGGPALTAGEPAAAAAGAGSLNTGWPGAAQAAASRRRWPLAAAGLLAGALYCLVVGSFTRYSWPATIGVVAVGAAVVSRGWRGPLLRRPDPGPLPRAGTAVWGGLLVAGGLWELSALLQQPSLETGSYAHPTISVLTDPLLASTPGRALVLAVWLALGWALVRR